MKEQIEDILLKYAKTQNSFIREDGSNGWNDLIQELETLVEPKDNDILSVGFHKGEVDFGISARVSSLSHEKYNEIRTMTVVAIGIMEDMWRRSNQEQACAQG